MERRKKERKEGNKGGRKEGRTKGLRSGLKQAKDNQRPWSPTPEHRRIASHLIRSRRSIPSSGHVHAASVVG